MSFSLMNVWRAIAPHPSALRPPAFPDRFALAAIGMGLIAPNGRWLEVNPRLCAMTGYSEATLLSTTILDLMYPEDRATLSAMLSPSIPDGATGQRELRLPLADGRVIWVELTITPLTDNNGKPPSAWSVIIQDINNRKALNAAYQAKQRHLETEVEDLTRELRARTQELQLARHQAEEALRSADAADRTKSVLLATMSHEIRTPLNGVIGFTDLLLDGPLTEAKRPHVELVQQSAENLLHLLNDFLDYSKIEAGVFELEPSIFDLHDEVDRLLALVGNEARKKGLVLDRQVVAPAYLRGDVGRLRQILLNLLNNAIKFTNQGQVCVRCEELAQQGNTSWLRIRIEDTGIGIAAADVGKLFQPFSQVARSAGGVIGSGLGLAICKRLAEAMGGNVGVHSRAGQGSQFWVELLFERPADVVGQLPGRQNLNMALPSANCQARVLVVDDNPVSQLLAATILARLGLQVDVVNDGQQAILATQRQPYDLIFMDCDMPVMDGFDATRAIRSLEGKTRQMPIVAFTASALSGDVDKCLAAGMNDFLAKPVRPHAMMQTALKWLQPIPGCKEPEASAHLT